MFNSLLAEYKTPFGAVAAGEELSLRFALPAGDGRTPELLLYRAGQALPLLRLPLSPASASRTAPCCTVPPTAAPTTAKAPCGSSPSTIKITASRKNSPGR